MGYQGYGSVQGLPTSYTGFPSATPTATGRDPNYGINFAPEATSPWANPGVHRSGQHYARKEPWDVMGTNRGTVDEYSPNEWADPFKKWFGGNNSFSGTDKQQLGGLGGKLGEGPNLGGYEPNTALASGAQGGKGASLNAPPAHPGAMPGYQPTGFADLKQQIGDLSYEQLRQLDMNPQRYRGQFAGAAQDYANAFANPTYAPSFHGDYKGMVNKPKMNLPWNAKWDDPMMVEYNPSQYTQPNVSNWLQSSYDQLHHRLDDAGYL